MRQLHAFSFFKSKSSELQCCSYGTQLQLLKWPGKDWWIGSGLSAWNKSLLLLRIGKLTPQGLAESRGSIPTALSARSQTTGVPQSVKSDIDRVVGRIVYW